MDRNKILSYCTLVVVLFFSLCLIGSTLYNNKKTGENIGAAMGPYPGIAQISELPLQEDDKEAEPVSTDTRYVGLTNRGDGGVFFPVNDEPILGVVSEKSIKLRNYPSTDTSDVITGLKEGAEVEVLSRWENWYKVETAGKTTGWLRNDLITLENIGSTENMSALISSREKAIPLERPKEVVPKGQQIANYARKFFGVKYVWGGTTPKGFDCSGLVQYVYRQFGVRLARVSSEQATQGIKVSKSELRPGDLVFFDTNGGRGSISHVGIYAGDGKFIEAASGYSSSKVKITDMTSGYYSQNYVTARRVLSN